jgi:hypothetical protein
VVKIGDGAWMTATHAVDAEPGNHRIEGNIACSSPETRGGRSSGYDKR